VGCKEVAVPGMVGRGVPTGEGTTVGLVGDAGIEITGGRLVAGIAGGIAIGGWA
jgi:sporulation protein YlmC with PRC-barrel domain